MGKVRLASNRSPDWAFMERFEVPNYDTDGNYLTRWRIVQTPWFAVMIHRFDGPDPRPTLHDHPWPFLSIVLRGGYVERTLTGARCVRHLNHKAATGLHSIRSLLRTPTWTLMLCGKRCRVWGYLDDDGTWTRFDEHPHNEEFAAARARRA